MTILGIDLGTSHSSLASISNGAAKLLDIPQLENAHDLVSEKLLASVYYHDPAASLRLPWDENPPILGRYARDQSIMNPELAITSAKSWLCYHGEAKLPPKAQWGGKTAKEVSALILSHLMQAYTHAGGSEADSVVLTVPASFNPLAKQLTEDAARLAGIKNCELLEEPLAAFYAWLAANPDWNKQLKAGDSVLIVDVGGGTSDFSLIAVGESSGELQLDRIAVGRHLLLGGDNMDLALAHALALKQGGLDHWQFVSLQQEVRRAKEKLLSDGQLESYPLSISGRGSSLFANTLRFDLSQAEVKELILEGFFPSVPADAPLQRAMGLQTMGLPYESDPAITKHLANFLRTALRNACPSGDTRFGQKGEQALFLPTHVLFNGGVFKASAIADRVYSALQSWGSNTLVRLESPDLDHAVTLGAAYYAYWKTSDSRLRVRTTAPRSYYIGVEANAMAVPGMRPQLQGLCVLPLGTEEGTTFVLSDQEFALWGGDEVRFSLFSGEDQASLASLLPNAEVSLDQVAVLSSQISDDGDGPIPVRLEVAYDATGTLGLQMRESGGSRAWKLAFDIRDLH